MIVSNIIPNTMYNKIVNSPENVKSLSVMSPVIRGSVQV